VRVPSLPHNKPIIQTSTRCACFGGILGRYIYIQIWVFYLKNTALAFRFLTLFLLLLGSLGHIVVVVGLLTDEAVISDFYLLTPISIAFVFLNVLIVNGLKALRKWAYLLGGVEMLSFIIVGCIQIWTSDFSSTLISLVLVLLSIKVLFSLKAEYKTNVEIM
jgi:hypothetical protein